MIRVARWPGADLAYHVLSRLDLGRDAASLFRPLSRGTATPDWALPLRAAYLADPAAAQLQWIGLRHPTRESLRAAVDAGPPTALSDALRTALGAEACLANSPDRIAYLSAEFGSLLGQLAPLRQALYGGGAVPDLTLIHVPALGRHGRGLGTHSQRRVATDLTQPDDHALLQVLHEECHAATDREVHPRGAAPRETRAGTPGHAVHLALEAAAVRYGSVLIDDVAPHLAPAYARWMARSGRGL